MKLVVFSDAHGRKELVDRVLDFNPDADAVINLGDSEMEQKYFTKRNIIHVKGNYPLDPGQTYNQVCTFGSLKVFITHGHKYKVHYSLDLLIEHAELYGYNIVLYGHTHILFHKMIGDVRAINPGSLSNPRSMYPPSYCIINIDNEDVTVIFKEAYTNETIEVMK
jgi:putative phosphoesterase